MVQFLYWFHICSWQPVNLLVDECEAGGGDRILFVCELFFFFVFFFPTYLLCVHVRMYLQTCICVYMHVCMCRQYVMYTMCICKLCYLLWSLCSFFCLFIFFVFFFPSLTLPGCGLRSS